MFPFASGYPVLPPDEFLESQFYNFIIIGGGTAGCVLANRLTEDPSVSVLLLERGAARTGWGTRVRLLSSNFMGDDGAAYRWPAARPVGEARTLALVAGKGLGGGSAINSMQYTRGFPREYDAWSESGRRGWSYEEVEPYFVKSQEFVNTDAKAGEASEHRGTRGEWKVREMGEFYFPLAKRCVEASTALGIPFSADINDPANPLTLSAKLDCTIQANGHRSSTFTAFLPKEVHHQKRPHVV
ncbi:glucose-methanol-choline oxidoreductase [Mycena filopes]|nr:glucose-methanol-choline oxidoreductase [Mycena filopes]